SFDACFAMLSAMAVGSIGPSIKRSLFFFMFVVLIFDVSPYAVVNNNLYAAMRSTVANTYLTELWVNFLAPANEPANPPAKATAIYRNMFPEKETPWVTIPPSPASELTKINTALIAAVCFWLVHFIKINRGERMTPPPIPMRPESRPMLAPTATETGTLAVRRSL